MMTIRLPDGSYATTPVIMLGLLRLSAEAVMACEHDWAPDESTRTLVPHFTAIYLTLERCSKCNATRCHMTGDQAEMDAAHGYDPN